MEIREAAFQESETLQRLQAQTPQGKSLIVSTVNIPDFFSRARAYDSWAVFNAYEQSRIVGSGACAIREAVLGDAIHRVGYEFQYFTAPDFRRRKVAWRLSRGIEHDLRDQGAALSYALVMEGNIPSMRVLERRGFYLHRRLVMPSVVVRKQLPVPDAACIRSMTPDDVDAVAALIGRTWQGHDLFEPITAESLARQIERLENLDYRDIVVFEDRDDISACVALWDWSKIMRITVLRFTWKMRLLFRILYLAGVLPRLPKPGDILRQMMLTLIGYNSLDPLASLVKHANNRALERGVEQLFCICPRGSRILESLKGFTRVNTGIHLYVKPLQPGIAMGDAPAAITGFDM